MSRVAAAIDTVSLHRQMRITRRKLDQMKRTTRRKIIRAATRSAGGVVTKALKPAAPKSRGKLRRTFGNQVRNNERGNIEAVIGQNRIKRKKLRAVHIHLADQPTRPHILTGAKFILADGEFRGGDFRHPGTRGARFMNSTQLRTRSAAVRQFANAAAKGIDKEAKRLKAT